jgi:hypothetical protein
MNDLTAHCGPSGRSRLAAVVAATTAIAVVAVVSPARAAEPTAATTTVSGWGALQGRLGQHRAASGASAVTGGGLSRAAVADQLRTSLRSRGLAPRPAGSAQSLSPSVVDAAVTVTVNTPSKQAVSFAPTAGATASAPLTMQGSHPVYDVEWGPSGEVRVQHSDALDPDMDWVTGADGDTGYLRSSHYLWAGQRSWSPLGDSFVGIRPLDDYVYAVPTAGQLARGHGFEGGSAFGSAVVSPYADVVLSAVGDAGHHDIGWQEDDFPLSAATLWAGPGRGVLGLDPAYQLAEPETALPPGTTVFDDVPPAEYLAFKGLTLDTATPKLFVDHADGANGANNPVAVADLGRLCDFNQLAFSPSHTAIAYVKAVGPSGSECTRTELHVLRATGARYDSGTTDVLVSTSAANAPYSAPSWRAKTPPAAAYRLGGRDRVEVAVNASQFSYADHEAPAVVLAGSTAYADALAGTPLATRAGGPVLFSASSTLDSRTAAEIDRVLQPTGTVYLVGGPATLSDAVKAAVSKSGRTVKRLGGANRFDVALGIATEIDTELGGIGAVFVADGLNWPDALVSGPAAGLVGGVVVLSRGGTLTPDTESFLDSFGFAGPPDLATGQTGVWAVGGNAITATADRADTAALGGANRFAVAATVADTFFSGPSITGLADGRNWPDAVSGGATMARMGQPIMLTNGANYAPGLREHIDGARGSIDMVLAFGGTASVPDSAVTAAVARAGTQTVLYGPSM